MILAFLLIIFGLSLLTIFTNASSISSLENRSLAGIPDLTRENLVSGEYFDQWESYVTDHFYHREGWLEDYSLINMKILKKQVVNDIVITEDGYLLPFIPYEKPSYIDWFNENVEVLTANIRELEKIIGENGGEFYFVGIPEQSSYLRDKYPKIYRNNEEYLNNGEEKNFAYLNEYSIKNINMGEEFKEEDPSKPYYLKTDHHYTFRGGLKTYQVVMDYIYGESGDKNHIGLGENEIDFKTIEKPILGSRNRKLSFLYETDEGLEIGYPKVEISYEKYDNGIRNDEFFIYDKNERPDYGVYMGGDQAETIIKTNRPDREKLLIVGDSFTNAVEPLFYYHFDETRSLDLRYYNEMSLVEYIKSYRPDRVIMIRDDLNYATLEGNGNFGI